MNPPRPAPRRRASTAGAVLAWVLLSASAARACSIPVFRYALERWPAGRYEMTVFRVAPLSAAERAALDALSRSPANLRAVEFDVGPGAAPLPQDAAALWQAQKPAAAARSDRAWAVLRFPDGDKNTPDLWAGPLEGSAAAGLTDSPVRARIAADLLAGQSAVFVLVEGGDKAKDAAAARLLRDELTAQEKSLKLAAPDPDAPGPQLRSELPLRLAFTVVRVARDDPAERLLVRMLAQVIEEDAKKMPASEPMAFAVFGRGRALPPLAGRSLGPLGIADTAQFVAGDCSCEIKDLNPGADLLMAADWDKVLDEGGAKAAPADTSGVSTAPAAAAKPAPARVTPAAQKFVANLNARGSNRPWLWAGLGVTLLLVLLTGAWAARSSRRPRPR